MPLLRLLYLLRKQHVDDAQGTWMFVPTRQLTPLCPLFAELGGVYSDIVNTDQRPGLFFSADNRHGSSDHMQLDRVGHAVGAPTAHHIQACVMAGGLARLAERSIASLRAAAAGVTVSSAAGASAGASAPLAPPSSSSTASAAVIDSFAEEQRSSLQLLAAMSDRQVAASVSVRLPRDLYAAFEVTRPSDHHACLVSYWNMRVQRRDAYGFFANVQSTGTTAMPFDRVHVGWRGERFSLEYAGGASASGDHVVQGTVALPRRSHVVLGASGSIGDGVMAATVRASYFGRRTEFTPFAIVMMQDEGDGDEDGRSNVPSASTEFVVGAQCSLATLVAKRRTVLTGGVALSHAVTARDTEAIAERDTRVIVRGGVVHAVSHSVAVKLTADVASVSGTLAYAFSDSVGASLSVQHARGNTRVAVTLGVFEA